MREETYRPAVPARNLIKVCDILFFYALILAAMPLEAHKGTWGKVKGEPSNFSFSFEKKKQNLFVRDILFYFYFGGRVERTPP